MVNCIERFRKIKKKTAPVRRPESMFRSTLSVKCVKAVLVDSLGRKPNCLEVMILLSLRKK